MQFCRHQLANDNYENYDDDDDDDDNDKVDDGR